MARRKASVSKTGDNVTDYRHTNVKRLNIPPAGLAARGNIAKETKLKYAHNPHLAPTLRFDASGGADRIAELIVTGRGLVGAGQDTGAVGRASCAVPTGGSPRLHCQPARDGTQPIAAPGAAPPAPVGSLRPQRRNRKFRRASLRGRRPSEHNGSSQDHQEQISGLGRSAGPAAQGQAWENAFHRPARRG